jgi:hypothetical protein
LIILPTARGRQGCLVFREWTGEISFFQRNGPRVGAGLFSFQGVGWSIMLPENWLSRAIGEYGWT